MKQLQIALLICFAFLQYSLWIGDKNYFDYLKLKAADAKIQQQNEGLSFRNNRLLAEVVDIKAGGETIETLARSQLGWIKPGETFYQIVEANP